LDLEVSSVWSVNRPSRNDGFISGLSQYPVFKVQAAADSLHILRFCPLPSAVLLSAARRYITCSFLRCQQGSSTFLRHRFVSTRIRSDGHKKTPRPGGVRSHITVTS
jgi:hypothetical protein